MNVPKWIPGVGGKKFGVNISKVPAYASGTSYSKGGLAQIHEKGGELRQLSSGETIIPADKSKKIINNNNNTDSPIIIQIYGNVYGVSDLVNIIGSAISNRVKLAELICRRGYIVDIVVSANNNQEILVFPVVPPDTGVEKPARMKYLKP